MIAAWLMFAFLSPILYSGANYCDKILLDHFGYKPVELCGLVYIGFALCSLVVALIIGGPFAEPSAGIFPFLVGVLFVVYAIPYYKALTLDEASVVVPLFQFSPLFVIFAEVGFMGVTLTPEQILGTALILMCGFAAAIERDTERLFRLRPALWFMLLSCVLYAASGPLMSLGLEQNSQNSSLLYQSIGMLVTALGLYFGPRSSRHRTGLRTGGLFWGLLSLNCVLATVALLGTLRAIDEVSASLVRVVEASQPIFVFFLGAVLTRLYPRYVTEVLNRRIVLKKLLIGVGIVVGAFFIQKT
ncbi:MAG: hypothetical protein RL417_2283 [Pseudomonadota bacterium]|jgi:drug/metabolite transporter (DMT)-like permease